MVEGITQIYLFLVFVICVYAKELRFFLLKLTELYIKSSTFSLSR